MEEGRKKKGEERGREKGNEERNKKICSSVNEFRATKKCTIHFRTNRAEGGGLSSDRTQHVSRALNQN